MAKQTRKGRAMQPRAKSGGKPSRKRLSNAEIANQQGSDLPDREAMSLVNANLAAPINAAVALNALSDNSAALANAQQTAPITQSI
jgi:hypothetical protein